MKITDEQIIVALMTSKTNAQAAEQLQMSESQLYERMSGEDFKQQLRETQAQLLARTSDMMLSKAAEAVSVIEELMSNKETPASVRLSAASTLLKQVTAVRQFQWTAEQRDKDEAFSASLGIDLY